MENTREIVYLRGNADWRLVIDGPALRLKRPRQSDQLLPLRRIRQINSHGAIHWDTQALMGCARYGIPVYFCNLDGEMLARFLPPSAPMLEDLGELLEACATDPECSRKLHRWIQAQRRIAQNRLAAGTERLADRRRRSEWAAGNTPGLSRPAYKKAWRQLECFLECDLRRTLWQQGLEPAGESLILRGLPLEELLAEILILQLMPDMLQGFPALAARKGKRLEKIRFEQVVSLHHRMRSAIERNLDRLMHQLHLHLLENRP